MKSHPFLSGRDGLISWFRYARHAAIPAFEAKGWAVSADLGLPHSFYSVLMIWRGSGEP